MTIQNAYTTRDFYAAAYFVASGMELQEYYKQKGLTTFVFTDNEQLQLLVRKFYSLDALVNPVTYGNALRNLKSMIHADTKQKGTYVSQSEYSK